MSQLRQQAAQLQIRQTSVLVVTFEQEWRAARYAVENDFPWPLVIDSDRELYAAYGMERGSVGEVMGWSSWKAYIPLLLAGRRIERPTNDILQLGGDVIVDPRGTVCFHHVGRGPADRPSIEQLFGSLDIV